jgi:hypothetical protein
MQQAARAHADKVIELFGFLAQDLAIATQCNCLVAVTASANSRSLGVQTGG